MKWMLIILFANGNFLQIPNYEDKTACEIATWAVERMEKYVLEPVCVPYTPQE